MIQTVAIKQAIYYGDIIYEHLSTGDLAVEDKLLHDFYILYSMAYFYDNNYPSMLTICDEGKRVCEG